MGASLGFSASGDVQRSPRALSLLQWYYQRVEPLPEVQTAIQKYVVRVRTAGSLTVNTLAQADRFNVVRR